MKRFLLVDDHAVIRSALKMILKNLFIDVVIEEAYDGDSAIEKLKSGSYDMMMLDVNMPGTDSFSLVHNILALQPHAKILMFSMNPEEVYARRYLQLGAKGYLKKDAPEEEIRKAILTVMNNKRYISSTLADVLVRDAFEEKTANPFDFLSAREFEICQHLLTGEAVGEISRKLYLNPSTISSHKSKIYQKLGVNNEVELRKLAEAYQII